MGFKSTFLVVNSTKTGTKVPDSEPSYSLIAIKDIFNRSKDVWVIPRSIVVVWENELIFTDLSNKSLGDFLVALMIKYEILPFVGRRKPFISGDGLVVYQVLLGLLVCSQLTQNGYKLSDVGLFVAQKVELVTKS